MGGVPIFLVSVAAAPLAVVGTSRERYAQGILDLVHVGWWYPVMPVIDAGVEGRAWRGLMDSGVK